MSESEQSGAGRREVAYRLFAAEFDDADYSYSESDEERAPNYVITPTGARVNRLFVVGVLTEVESVSEDVLRARVVDPTGAFVLYAGQYQPDEQAFLDGAQTPTFVAVTGKARTFQPDDSDRVFTSVRPESISEVDATTRDRWTVQTAEQTLERVSRMAAALDADLRGDQLRDSLENSGVDEGLAAGIPLAIDHYGTTAGYLAELRALAIDAARLVAGEVEEVEGLAVAPDEGADTDPSELVGADIDLAASAAETGAAADTGATARAADPEASAGTAASGPDNDGNGTDAARTEPTSDDQSAESSAAESVRDSSDPEMAAETSEPAVTGDTGGTESTEPASVSEPSGDDEGEEPVGGSADDEDIGDFDPGEFDLDEEEREEIEEEYGTEFQSGTDVPDPGEVDIETPDPEEVEADVEGGQEPESGGADEPAATGPVDEPTAGGPAESDLEEEATAEESGEPETIDETATAEPTADPAAEGDSHDAGEPAEDVDLEDAAVDLMTELDEGDGASKEAVIDALGERYDASEADAEDAVQDALMDGRCYEPDDGTLKPI